MSPATPSKPGLPEGPIEPFDLALACYLYEAMTPYKGALDRFHETTGTAPDLKREDHRLALLKFLNDWGCRNLATQWHIGSLRLEKVSGATLNALYAKLATEGKRDGKTGLSPRTVHHVHTCLHRAFRDAVRWNRLFRNPVDAADPPKVAGPGGREMKTWDATQVRAFLEATHNDRLHPLWRLLAMTGMRRGEVLGLKWEDIDFEARRLSVRRSLIPLGGEVIVSEPKTVRGRRSIALDPETVEVLKAQAARQLVEQQQWGEAWTDTGYICTKEDGTPYHPEVVSRHFRRAVKEARLPTIRPHDLRHTHATLALRAGIHPKVVSERLGHATVSITLDTYSHAIPAMQEEAATLIAELVFAAEKQ